MKNRLPPEGSIEEMFFAGPARAGSIAPNVLVKPEQGNNFDIGATFDAGGISGGAYLGLKWKAGQDYENVGIARRCRGTWVPACLTQPEPDARNV